MKISKRDNKALQKRLINIYQDILGDAESEFCQAVMDEVQAYIEDEDDIMEVMETYSNDAMEQVYTTTYKAMKGIK